MKPDFTYKLIMSAILSLISLFEPARPMVITCLTLVTADLITGILAARKRGEKISSSRLRDSFTKALIFVTGILLAFLVEKYLTGSDMPVCKWIAGLIGIAELTSCMENLNTLSNGDLLKTVISKLGSANKD